MSSNSNPQLTNPRKHTLTHSVYEKLLWTLVPQALRTILVETNASSDDVLSLLHRPEEFKIVCEKSR